MRLLVSGPVVWKNPGNNPGNIWDETGLLSTTQEGLEWYRISRLFPENLYKQYDSGLFLVGTVKRKNA